MGTETMEGEIGVVMRKFGDEQSTLLDQFERLSFEVKLNQAILARSLSEPCMGRSKLKPHAPPRPAALVRRGRSGLGKIVRKLLKPMVGWKCRTMDAPKGRDVEYCEALSRSLRFGSQD